MRWVAYGTDALLIHFAEKVGEEAFLRGRAVNKELESRPPEGLREFVLGFTSVLLEFDPQVVPNPRLHVLQYLAQLKSAFSQVIPDSPIREIPVVYDGPDLARVAAYCRMDASEVVKLHSEPVYRVYALGFSPGFPYLGELNTKLHVPRLGTPRPRVPGGSVAIGGEHTGIYPSETAGGWNLIGRTLVHLFDLHRAARSGRDGDAFYLQPGDRVRFVKVN